MSLEKESGLSTGDITVIAEMLSWPARFLLGFISFAGTAVYAASFALTGYRERLMPIAIAIGIASGISWIVFGLVLLLATRGRPSILAWVDTCLVTQSMGIAVLMLTALINLIVYAAGATLGDNSSALLHLGILIAADIVMAITFVRRAIRTTLNRSMALALWILALNGIFALLLALMWPTGGAQL